MRKTSNRQIQYNVENFDKIHASSASVRNWSIKLQTDKGTEFLNPNFQSCQEENSIHFFTTNSELKASVLERFNRTLRTLTWKYFTAKNTRKIFFHKFLP